MVHWNLQVQALFQQKKSVGNFAYIVNNAAHYSSVLTVSTADTCALHSSEGS